MRNTCILVRSDPLCRSEPICSSYGLIDVSAGIEDGVDSERACMSTKTMSISCHYTKEKNYSYARTCPHPVR